MIIGYAPVPDYLQPKVRTYPMLHDEDCDLREVKERVQDTGFNPLALP